MAATTVVLPDRTQAEQRKALLGGRPASPGSGVLHDLYDPELLTRSEITRVEEVYQEAGGITRGNLQDVCELLSIAVPSPELVEAQFTTCQSRAFLPKSGLLVIVRNAKRSFLRRQRDKDASDAQDIHDALCNGTIDADSMLSEVINNEFRESTGKTADSATTEELCRILQSGEVEECDKECDAIFKMAQPQVDVTGTLVAPSSLLTAGLLTSSFAAKLSSRVMQQGLRRIETQQGPWVDKGQFLRLIEESEQAKLAEDDQKKQDTQGLNSQQLAMRRIVKIDADAKGSDGKGPRKLSRETSMASSTMRPMLTLSTSEQHLAKVTGLRDKVASLGARIPKGGGGVGAGCGGLSPAPPGDRPGGVSAGSGSFRVHSRGGGGGGRVRQASSGSRAGSRARRADASGAAAGKGGAGAARGARAGKQARPPSMLRDLRVFCPSPAFCSMRSSRSALQHVAVHSPTEGAAASVRHPSPPHVPRVLLAGVPAGVSDAVDAVTQSRRILASSGRIYSADQASAVVGPRTARGAAQPEGSAWGGAGAARVVFHPTLPPPRSAALTGGGHSPCGSPRVQPRNVDQVLSVTNLLLSRRLTRRRALNYAWATHLSEVARLEAGVMLDAGQQYFACHAVPRQQREGVRRPVTEEELPVPPSPNSAARLLQRFAAIVRANGQVRLRRAALATIRAWLSTQCSPERRQWRRARRENSVAAVAVAGCILACVQKSLCVMARFLGQVCRPRFFRRCCLIMRIQLWHRAANCRLQLAQRQEAVKRLRDEECRAASEEWRRDKQRAFDSEMQRCLYNKRTLHVPTIQRAWRCYAAKQHVARSSERIVCVRDKENELDAMALRFQLLARRRAACVQVRLLRSVRNTLVTAFAIAAHTARYNLTDMCSTTIQRSARLFLSARRHHLRSCQMRAYVEARVAQENACDRSAVLIQQWFVVRMQYIKEKRKDKRGNAIRIQCWWRCIYSKRLRQYRTHRRECYVREIIESQAATAIQRLARGCIQRAAYTRLQLHFEQRTDERVHCERTSTAVWVIETAMRRFAAQLLVDRNSVLLEQLRTAENVADRAACAVQRLHRVYQARRVLQGLQHRYTARTQRRLMEEDRLYTAAACIQRAARCAVERSARRHAAGVLRLHHEKRIFHECPRHTAASAIQRCFRCSAARRAVRGRQARVHALCSLDHHIEVIQRCAWYRIAWSRYAALKAAEAEQKKRQTKPAPSSTRKPSTKLPRTAKPARRKPQAGR